MRPVAASKPADGSGSSKNVKKNANSGSGPRKNDEKNRTRAKASNNADGNGSQPKKDAIRKHQPKQVYTIAKAEALETVNPGVSTGPTTPHPTPKPSPAPQIPVHVNLKSADFTSLFSASLPLSTAPSSTDTKAIPADDASRRVQLVLEHQGGDYSKLVSGSLVTSQGDPLLYAESTMARRRELGFKRRSGALRIVQGMVGRSQGFQPTA